MAKYNTERFDPPAPIAAITIRSLDQSTIVRNVTMFIDSGSDITFLPSSAIRRLSLRSDQQWQYDILAFDGRQSQTAVTECELVFAGQSFTGEYGIVEADEGLLGRDILNYFRLLLDGPALEWRVVTDIE